MSFTEAFMWVGFGIGGLALGVWAVLGFYWFKNTTGVLKVSLVWLSIYMVATLGIRISQQIANFNGETFDAWLTPTRTALNIAVLALGLYLAKNSGRINREGELNESRDI